MQYATGILPAQSHLPVRRCRAWFYDPTVDGCVNTNIPLDAPQKPVNVATVIEKKLTEINKLPMQTLHLVNAILKTIASLHSAKENFSAYTITKTLREKVNAGEHLLVDVPQTYIGGKMTANIRHDDVRSVVVELFSLDMIPDYTGAPYYDSAHDVSYHLYSHSANSANSGPQTPAFAVPTAPVVLAPAAPLSPALKPADHDMWNKVLEYIRNKRIARTAPTMKQIQSRLKGYSVTCQDILDYLVSRGYTVWRSTGKVSEATVN